MDSMHIFLTASVTIALGGALMFCIFRTAYRRFQKG
jgi:hypothetical protein